MRARSSWITIFLGILGTLVALFFALGLHSRPRYIQNFEEEEYGRDRPFLAPNSVVDGLAVYAISSGLPLLLFPYPHSHTIEPMAQTPLAEMLSRMGRSVITFDVPGAYRSTRQPVGDMAEMIRCADEALDRLDVQEPVDVVGHSMGGLVALAYAIERSQRVRRLVLVTTFSGFPAAARWGLPGSAFRVYEPDYWRLLLWGVWLNAGRGDLALHKQLQNLMTSVSFHDKSCFIPVAIDVDDYSKGVPIRTMWSRNMYARLSYARRLDAVKAPTLILAGKFDPQAPRQCAEELLRGLPDARLVMFERSGHAPFIEEPASFARAVERFINEEGQGQ